MKKQLLWPLLLAVLAGSVLYYFFNPSAKLFRETGLEQALNQQLADCPYDRNFCAYVVAQAKALEQGVVIDTTSTAADGSTSTSQTKMDGAGSIATTSYLNGELQANVVLYAGQTYVQDLTDQAWYVMRLDFDQAVSSDDVPVPSYNDPRQTYDLDAMAEVKKVGTEACGDLTCDKYELLSAQEMANAAPTYLLIDTKEHLARRLEMMSEEGNLVMTYAYDEKVSVEKPYPLKEMPAITFPSGELDEMPSDLPGQMPSEMPSQQELEQMMQNYGLDG